MRFLVLMAVVAYLLRPTWGRLPACANDCLLSAVSGSSCSRDGTLCICEDDSSQHGFISCLVRNCSPKEQLAARNITDTTCGISARDKTLVNPIVTTAFGIPAILSSIVRLSDFGRLSGAEDSFLTVALLSAILVGCLEYPASLKGFGRDMWHIAVANITDILRLSFIVQISYVVSTSSYKMAFLCLYLRIFWSDGPIRRAIHGLMVLVSLYFLIFLLLVTFHCQPVSYSWTFWAGETAGTCLDFNAISLACAICNIGIDLSVILLPTPRIFGLRLKRTKKILVFAMLSTGSFVLIVSIIRLRAILSFGKTTNPTWDNVGTAYWSTIECFTAVVCANLPSIRQRVSKTLTRSGLGSGQSDSDTHDVPFHPPSQPHGRIQREVNVTVAHYRPCPSGFGTELRTPDEGSVISSIPSTQRPKSRSIDLLYQL
ncbi:hypothetical protein BJX63DRAFT_417232 [Aspergillus granulosus]|uniref:CFEM domain-containing protein n=1 Tax=Aspergillus granulosus TaxID=176169 RepID=A0ABR4GR12_9EURO